MEWYWWFIIIGIIAILFLYCGYRLGKYNIAHDLNDKHKYDI
jgi:hypothetical protein